MTATLALLSYIALLGPILIFAFAAMAVLIGIWAMFAGDAKDALGGIALVLIGSLVLVVVHDLRELWIAMDCAPLTVCYGVDKAP